MIFDAYGLVEEAVMAGIDVMMKDGRKTFIACMTFSPAERFARGFRHDTIEIELVNSSLDLQLFIPLGSMRKVIEMCDRLKEQEAKK